MVITPKKGGATDAGVLGEGGGSREGLPWLSGVSTASCTADD